MNKLLIKYGGDLNKEKRSLHEILTSEEEFGMYRIIREQDPDFEYMKDKGDIFDLKEFGGYTTEYVAFQKHSLEFPMLFNVPDTLLEINTNKKIIIPTEESFGRIFGHVFRKFYFDGTHNEFMERLKEEGYKIKK